METFKGEIRGDVRFIDAFWSGFLKIAIPAFAHPTEKPPLNAKGEINEAIQRRDSWRFGSRRCSVQDVWFIEMFIIGAIFPAL